MVHIEVVGCIYHNELHFCSGMHILAYVLSVFLHTTFWSELRQVLEVFQLISISLLNGEMISFVLFCFILFLNRYSNVAIHCSDVDFVSWFGFQFGCKYMTWDKCL